MAVLMSTLALNKGEWLASHPGHCICGSNSPCSLLDWRLGELQDLSGCCGEGENLLPLVGIDPGHALCSVSI
jgi:hypothetical protein